MVGANLIRAIELHQAGDLNAAEAIYRQILIIEPADPNAWHLYGVLLKASREVTTSLSMISRSLQLNPNTPHARHNLLNTLRQSLISLPGGMRYQDRDAAMAIYHAGLNLPDARNKMPRTVLTIAIPTYNRLEKLDACLNSIVLAARDEDVPKFKVIVSDNSPHLQTHSVISKYQKNNSNIFFFKNVTNLGFCWNFVKLSLMSNSDYIWFIGDDDLVLEDGIHKIISAINTCGSNFISFNVIPFNNSGYERIFFEKAPFDDKTPSIKGTLYNLCSQFGALSLMGGIANCIANSDMLSLVRFERYDNPYLHTTALLDVLWEEKANIFDDTIWIRNADGDEQQARWDAEGVWSRFFYFLSDQAKILRDRKITSINKSFFINGDTCFIAYLLSYLNAYVQYVSLTEEKKEHIATNEISISCIMEIIPFIDDEKICNLANSVIGNCRAKLSSSL